MKEFWKKVKRPLGWFLLIFLLGGLGGLVMQKYIAPFLASQPVLKNIGFLQPNSPIVITRTEQIRINENVSQRNLIKQLTPKVAVVLGGRGEPGSNFQERVRGTALIVSSDGLLAADPSLFTDTRNAFFLIDTNGKTFPLAPVAVDPKTDLVLAKAEGNGFSAVDFGFSPEIELGSDVLVLSGSEAENLVSFKPSSITKVGGDIASTNIFSSEKYRPPFSISASAASGSGIFNLSGQLLGMITADGDIIAAEVIRAALDSYFANKEINRASLGINYKILNSATANLLGLSQTNGILVIQTSARAARAGFAPGDVVTKVNGESINSRQTLDVFLNRSKPGEVWKLTVLRQGAEREITITLEELN